MDKLRGVQTGRILPACTDKTLRPVIDRDNAAVQLCNNNRVH